MKKEIFTFLIVVSSMFFITGCDFFDSSTTSSYNIDNNNKNNNSSNNNNYYDDIKNINVAENSILKLSMNTQYDIEYIDITDNKDGQLFMVKDNYITFKNSPDYENPQDSNRDNIYEVEVYLIDKNKNSYLVLFVIKVTNQNEDSNNDDTQTSKEEDSDNDYIPDNIEKLINYDSNDSDENNNAIPDGLEGDPFFIKQWYIKSIGVSTNPSDIASIEGNDMNLINTYKKYMGLNQIIQIIDSGVDVNHEDLKQNIDLSRSLDGDKQGNPTPGGLYVPHGTMLAGIAAARAFNGVGIRGVAPFAKIAGSNWLAKQSLDGLNRAWYSGPGANEITVSNNSWGSYYTADTIYEDIMQQAVTKLRDKKGRIFVFASGNAREQNADANIQYVLNNRYALVVGALNYENIVAKYSTPGANVWTVAYGGADDFNSGPTIATTYLSGQAEDTWESDKKRDYTYAMAGSSAAAPMVSGAIALIVEACPNLTYRDVKYLIAKTAKKIDSSNQSWIQNAAGFNFSRDYGFGLIDVNSAITTCQTNYKMLPQEDSTIVNKDTLNKEISKNYTEYIDIDKDLKVEWVEATIDIYSLSASKIDIYLTSPNGTKITLIKSGTIVDRNHIPYQNWMNGGFRFSTGAMIDESSEGQWRVEIVNNNDSDITLNSIKLKIYGHKGE